MKVSIDHNVCVGHGLCFMTAPKVYRDDEEGFGQVIGDGEVSEEHATEARLGARACPERAISVIE
jgi:ferredoxin